jgi:hypothetical protein
MANGRIPAMTKRSWSDLSPRTRRAVVALGGIQAALLAAAQFDLARRPAAMVSGSKTRWRLVTLVNLVGPIAYFVFGRREA